MPSGLAPDGIAYRTRLRNGYWSRSRCPLCKSGIPCRVAEIGQTVRQQTPDEILSTDCSTRKISEKQ